MYSRLKGSGRSVAQLLSLPSYLYLEYITAQWVGLTFKRDLREIMRGFRRSSSKLRAGVSELHKETNLDQTESHPNNIWKYRMEDTDTDEPNGNISYLQR